MAAVIAFVLMWWLFSGNGPQGPEGNDPVLLAPDVDASGDPDAASSPVPVALENGLRLRAYAEQPGDRIELGLMIPAGTCPDLLTPRVVESEVAVTVTLTHSTDPDCTPLAAPEQETVSVLLEGPLGDRSVLDGALAQQVRVEPSSRS